MSPQEMRPDSPVETIQEPPDPCQHWRGTLRFWGPAGGSRVIQRGDGIGVLRKSYLIGNIKRDQKRIVQQENQWRKEAEKLGLRGKPIKLQEKEFAPSMQATGTRLNSGGCPALGSLSRGSQKTGQVSRYGEPPRSRWKFSQKRREREKTTQGKAVFPGTCLFSLFFSFAFILFVIHRNRIQSHTGSADLSFIKIKCFIYMYTKGLRWCYINFWPRGLQTFYDPFFLITVSQPENLFSRGEFS